MAIGQFGKDLLVKNARFDPCRQFLYGLIGLVDALEIASLCDDALPDVQGIRRLRVGTE